MLAQKIEQSKLVTFHWWIITYLNKVKIESYKLYPKHDALYTSKIGNPTLSRGFDNIASEIGISMYLVNMVSSM